MAHTNKDEFGSQDIDELTSDLQNQVVDIKALGSFASGQKTVSSAGTAEVIASSTTIRSVSIRAHATNTGNVYVGNSGVTSSNGRIVGPAETIDIDVDNLADLYIDVDTNDEGISFGYLIA